MAQTRDAVLANPAAVSSPQYCSPYPLDLAIVRKVFTLTDGNFAVTDVNGNIIFKAKGFINFIHERKLLLDAAGNPIATLRTKIRTAHNRWLVFRGDSADSKDLLFSTKTAFVLSPKTTLEVFLANNKTEDVCDFKVKGSWLERSCVIYAGESSTVIAQMHKKHTAESIMLGKDNFMVTVQPNVDHAFTVSLILLLDQINHPFTV